MTIPTSDRVFTERSSRTIPRAASILSKKFRERMDLLVDVYGIPCVKIKPGSSPIGRSPSSGPNPP